MWRYRLVEVIDKVTMHRQETENSSRLVEVIDKVTMHRQETENSSSVKTVWVVELFSSLMAWG